jgi:hypothetical protein
VVVTIDNLKLPITTHIDKTTIASHYNFNKVYLQYVYHVPGMKKKEKFGVCNTIISTWYYILFDSYDVKVC